MPTLCVVLIFILSGCASSPFENWTKADTARQVAYTAGHCVDWLQTKEIAKSERYHELNPIIRDNEEIVDIYMGSALILQTLIPAMLKEPYRGYWQYLWIGLEAGTVYHNYKIGVRF